jgi:hypothetical protein
MKTDERPARIIRASEIGQYAYCARAWWLGSVKGVPSANTRELARGTDAHRQHGHRVWLADALRVLAALLVLAVIVIVVVTVFVAH